MQEVKTLDRRTFSLEAALAILSGVAITVSGCGGGSTTPTPTPTATPTPTPATGDKVGAISSNHGHTATITGAQLTAGAALNVELTLGNGHTHTVEISAADLTAIAANQKISHESTNNSGHSHTVTFN